MEQKYGALRICATLNKLIGWIILVVGLLAAIKIISTSGFTFGFPILIISIFIGLILIATGELIYVIIDIEANTRKSSFTETHQTSKLDAIFSNLNTNASYKSTLEFKNKLMQKGYVVNESNTNEGKYKCEVKKGTTLKYFYSANEFIAFASNETD
jgi:hypothetical protein